MEFNLNIDMYSGGVLVCCIALISTTAVVWWYLKLGKDRVHDKLAKFGRRLSKWL